MSFPKKKKKKKKKKKWHLFFIVTITDKMVTVTSVIFSWTAAAIKNTLHGRWIK